MSIVEKAIAKLNQKSAKDGVSPAAEAKRAPAVGPGQPMADGAAGRQASSRRLTIDHARLRDAGLLVPESEERRLAAEYRRIKRPLVEQAFADRATSSAAGSAKVIMIASACPGEGKTFTAINLALSLSLEQDTEVLLVDADVPKPHLTTLLGLNTSLGLLDALRDETIDVESLVYVTDVPRLSFLCAGSRSEMATELIASQRMQALVARLQSSNPRRLILLDSPPLLLTTESRELGVAAGQIVMVVRAGVTPRQAVFDAIAFLGPTKKVRLVLNDVEHHGTGSRYYGYGPYGAAPDRGE